MPVNAHTRAQASHLLVLKLVRLLKVWCHVKRPKEYDSLLTPQQPLPIYVKQCFMLVSMHQIPDLYFSFATSAVPLSK